MEKYSFNDYEIVYLLHILPFNTIIGPIPMNSRWILIFMLFCHNLVQAQQTVTLDSTSLPLIIINTNGGTIVNEPKIPVDMKIIYHGPGHYNKPTDAGNIYSGKAGIEYRGEFSQLLPQKPYGFETKDNLGNSIDVPLLNMPAENDWILLANYNDKAFSRNSLAFHLFSKMGHYAPRTSHCEVIVNGQYMGIFVFTEKIKRDKNRVDIARLDTSDKAGIDLTGGYIFALDYYNEDNSWASNFMSQTRPWENVYFVYKYPEPLDILAEQKSYIQAYVNAVETTLFSSDFMNPVTGYRAYVSVKSFIDYFLVNEISRNVDGFRKSCYYYKDRDDKGGQLHAGPVWDFDWAWKNIIDNCYIGEVTDGSNWAYRINECNDVPVAPDWIPRMLEDSTFRNELHTRYYKLRQTFLSDASMKNYVDSVAGLVYAAQQRHYVKWPILGQYTGTAEVEYPAAATFEGETDKLKNWITTRLAWLDDNMPGRIILDPIDTIPVDTIPVDTIPVDTIPVIRYRLIPYPLIPFLRILPIQELQKNPK